MYGIMAAEVGLLPDKTVNEPHIEIFYILRYSDKGRLALRFILNLHWEPLIILEIKKNSSSIPENGSTEKYCLPCWSHQSLKETE